MADGGFPTPAFCTMYNNNNNAIRASTNTVSAAQAPELCPKTGCIYTGHIRQDNTGLIIGTNTAGITGAANSVIYQTADAGQVQVQVNGNDYRVKTNLGGAQHMRVQNAAGALDAGNYMHMSVQGSVVQEIPANGYYLQTVNVGADGGYGDATTFAAESPHTTLQPIAMYFSATGSFSASEVVTLRIKLYDENDAGYDGGSYSLDGGNVFASYDAQALWYLLAATKGTTSDAFQRISISRVVLDAMSDAGTTTTAVVSTVLAIQN